MGAIEAAREAALGAYQEARRLADDGDAAAFDAAMERFKKADAAYRKAAGISGPLDYAQDVVGSAAGMPAMRFPSGYSGGSWNVGASVVDSINRRGTGFMAALVTGGSIPVTVPLSTTPVTDPRAARFLSDIIPMPDDGGAPNGHFSFLRQTVRTNLAAPVAKGAKKPTSIYTLERVDGQTVVVAHLSEPIDRHDLSDAPLLRQFLDDEMTYGLRLAVDDQYLNGDGTGAEMDGILAAGITTITPQDTMLATTRRAITTLEQRELQPGWFVFNPIDWEEIELEAIAQFASNPNMPAAVDRMARRLHGVPVLVTNRIAATFGLLGDFAGSSEQRQTGDIRIDWSEAVYDPDKFGVGDGGTAFEANQVVFRTEGRWAINVKRPDGFLQIDLGPFS